MNLWWVFVKYFVLFKKKVLYFKVIVLKVLEFCVNLIVLNCRKL